MTATANVGARPAVDRVISKLRGVRASARGYVALCPAHDDRAASLSISSGRDGRALVKCHAGCTTAAIVGALGLTTSDLFADQPQGEHRTVDRALGVDARARIVKTYDYLTADGELLFQVCRKEQPADNGAKPRKTFVQRRREPSGDWTYNLEGITPVLYRLPELLEAVALDKRVFVVEGEKCADALAELGYVATTSPMGAGKWREVYADALVGADVVILPDNDQTGRAHAAQVAASIAARGATVRVVELPGLPEKGDVVEWLKEGRTVAELEAVVGETSRWTGKLDIERAPTLEETPRPYKLFSAADLDELPPPRWIVDAALPERSIVSLIGAKGTMKTFVTLDLACHVATGFAWHGRRVTPGIVVYIYAEGPFGARARVDAWCALQREVYCRPVGRRDLPIWFLPTRIPINERAEVAALIAEIRRLADPPSLIVVDTLNQNLSGDEDGKGMGAFKDGCAMLRDCFGATVLAVHHTPIGADDRGRGHSSFDGAVDTRLIISRDAERVGLQCTHQRNGQDGWSVAYEATEIAGSLALKPTGPDGGKLAGQRREILELVHQLGTPAFSSLMRAAKDAGIGKSSFTTALKWLRTKSYVTMDNRKYRITDAGTLALSPTGPTRGPTV